MAWRWHHWTEVQIEVGGSEVAEVGKWANAQYSAVSTPKLMFDICVNVKQDLEVEAEAEHHQGVGSQPRAWGMADTHTHISRFSIL